MKKLIISAAIAFAAAVSQASSVNCGLSSAVDATTYATGTAYLICIDNLAKPSLTADTAAAWYKDNCASLSSKALFSESVTDGVINSVVSKDEAIGRKNYWLVIVAGDEKNFAVSTTTKALNITTSALTVTAKWDGASQMTSFATTSASVPEPTSGLMLLLGIAGLALKRKRA